MSRHALSARGHAPNCACPRCRHVRWWRGRITLREALFAGAIVAGAALNLLYPAERVLGTEPTAQELAR